MIDTLHVFSCIVIIIMLQVTLKEESVRVSDSISPTDLDTVFSFYPVIQVHVAV